MKNKLLPLFLVLGSLSAYSQVGIGTNNPDNSAQLEVRATNRGVLIPNVKLTSTTDVVTIKEPAESLLVFNINTIADITPGYYYWFKGRWNRLALAGEGSANAGIPAVSGVPGTDGVSIPSGANVVIDSTTGTVYVLVAGGDAAKAADWKPINGKDGKDGISGAPGLAGGKGVPGVDGVTPAAEINTWINTDTGVIYVKGKDGKWTPVSGLNGLDGKDGKDGLAGGKGVPGADGTATIDPNTVFYIDSDTGIIYVRDPKNPTKWIPLNGLDGKDGLAGAPGLAGGPGAPGANGSTPADGITTWIDTTTGTIYVLTPGGDPSNPADWKPINGTTGNNGKDGMVGGNGAPGTPGADGISKDSTIYVDNASGTVYILTPGADPLKPESWVSINGKDGAAGNNGKDGMIGGDGAPGTPGANGINADSTIYVDNTSGTVYILTPGADPLKPESWVSINGTNGVDGIAGAAGTPGTAGSITTLDAIVKDTNGDIYAYVGSDKTVAGRDAEWASKSPNWVKINGENGIPGVSGAPGTPGVSVPSGAPMVIDNTGTIYVLTPGGDPSNPADWKPINGAAGNNGKDGMVGGDGAPGTPGANGINADSTIYVDKTSGTVYILTPGGDANNPADWKPINAPQNNGSLTGTGVVSITNGKDILFADAVIKVNGGTAGQVLTSDGANDAKWVTPVTPALKVVHVGGAGTLDFANDFTIINATGSNGIVNFTLPTPTDASLIGKVYSIKRTDSDSNAIVKIVTASGTIDEADTQMTLGESNTVQIILESVAPVKWQVISRF